jgi:hypothetical protein
MSTLLNMERHPIVVGCRSRAAAPPNPALSGPPRAPLRNRQPPLDAVPRAPAPSLLLSHSPGAASAQLVHPSLLIRDVRRDYRCPIFYSLVISSPDTPLSPSPASPHTLAKGSVSKLSLLGSRQLLGCSTVLVYVSLGVGQQCSAAIRLALASRCFWLSCNSLWNPETPTRKLMRVHHRLRFGSLTAGSVERPICVSQFSPSTLSQVHTTGGTCLALP